MTREARIDRVGLFFSVPGMHSSLEVKVLYPT